MFLNTKASYNENIELEIMEDDFCLIEHDSSQKMAVYNLWV